MAARNGAIGLRLCANHDVHVVDVQGDLRDIWAGRETAATGKHTSRMPVISMRFDHVVDDALLRDALSLTGVRDSGGGVTVECRTVHAGSSIAPDPAGTSDPIGMWTSGTVKSTAQRYLYDFQIFATGSVGGTPHVAGAIAAGGAVGLANFSVNTDGTQPYAIIAGGSVALWNGSVKGAVTYGGAASIPPSIVTGAITQETPIDFASLAPRITLLADALTAQTPNADEIVLDHAVTFAGVNPGLSVFAIDAATLGAARSIEIHAPATAAVLIDVGGNRFAMHDLAVTLTGGITADRIVWNAPSAATITLSSLSFRGSLIAPRADVTLRNSDMTGQLVAATVGGNGVYKPVRFAGWEQFGAFGSSVTVTTSAPLERGCTYTLRIAGMVAPGNGCLEGTFSLPFAVDAQDRLAISRDADHIVWSPDHARVTSFVPREGVNTLTTEVLARYGTSLGAGAGDGFVKVSAVKSPILAGGNTVYFRQTHVGVPVIGGGFSIDEDGDGIARGAHGQVVSGLSNDVDVTTTAEQAKTTALLVIGARSPYPWNVQPARFEPPTATLAFVTTVAPASLAWHVDLSASGVGADYVDVDARSNVALARAPTELTHACKFPPTAGTEVSHGAVDVRTLFHGVQTIDTDVFQDGGVGEKALRSEDPMPILVKTGPAGGPPGSADRLASTVDVCTASAAWTDDDTRDAATAMWYVQQLGRFYADRGLKWGDAPWRGIDGKNEATLTVVTSSDASWQPDPGEPATYYGAVSSPLVDPYIVIDPDSIKTSSGDPAADAVQADILGHEFGHGIEAAVNARAGISMPRQSERGAMMEAWGDINGAAFARSLNPAAPWWCNGSDCLRDMRDPKASLDPDAPFPDTYKGVGYVEESPPCVPGRTHGGNDMCGVHIDITVVTHWFYLLATADNGDGVNDDQCTYAVPPIGLDSDEQFERAFTIAFYGLAQGQNLTFLAARDSTVSVARRLYGDDVARATEEAWLAVGVGSAPEISGVSPQDDARSVPTWPAALSWKTNDQGAWQIQIATDHDFTKDVQVVDAVEIEGGPARTLGAHVILDPELARYYWRVRRTSSAAWPKGACLAVFQFRPAQPEIHLLEPTMRHGDHFDADGFGTLIWEAIPGVHTYYVTHDVHAPAACPALDDGGVRTGSADGFDTEGYAYFFGSETPDFDVTYYDTIAALSPDGKSLGPCLIVPYRVRNFRRPEKISPLTGEWVNFKQPDAHYRFAPTDGAVQYEITITTPANNWRTIYTDTRPADELETGTLPDGTPYVDFPVPPKYFAGTTDPVWWTVSAIAEDGYVSPPDGGFVPDKLYKVGVGIPTAVSPGNHATNVPKSGLTIRWRCENCRKYDVTISHAGDGKAVFVATLDHVGDATAMQSAKVDVALEDESEYSLSIIAYNPGEPIVGGVRADFRTGPKPTLSPPSLVFDAVCEPMTRGGLGNILNRWNATELIVADDEAAADQFEIELRDFDTGDVNARAIMTDCEPVSAVQDACPPLTPDKGVACHLSEEAYTFTWSDAQQADAMERSKRLWGGFSYSYFRIRAIDSSQNVISDWSRRGVMVSCLFPELCNFDRDASGSVVGPRGSPINDPTIGAVCDDLLLAQIITDVAPAGSCVRWTP
jgi:choice-of-anchor A domain-containing protein